MVIYTVIGPKNCLHVSVDSHGWLTADTNDEVVDDSAADCGIIVVCVRICLRYLCVCVLAFISVTFCLTGLLLNNDSLCLYIMYGQFDCMYKETHCALNLL